MSVVNWDVRIWSGVVDSCHVTVYTDKVIKTFKDKAVKPTHPGEMLREDFMVDYGLTVAALAKALGASRQTINELLRERRAVTPAMALRLARLFGNTPEFWLNAQRAVDLWDAEQQFGNEIEKIKPLHAA